MGLDAAKFLTVTAVVLGLVLGFGLLRAAFGAPAIPTSAQGGEGEREGQRCRED